jgi:protein-S-isoprenylcysteine O-methyltransferase Ste14
MRGAVPLTVAIVLALAAGALIGQGTVRAGVFVGGALILVGLPLMSLARYQLGSAFAFTPQAKGLVTSGLYSRIPHPMYVFLDLALLGGIIMLRKVWLLIPWLGLVALQSLQARREAGVLERAYGDAYRDYRQRTWW